MSRTGDRHGRGQGVVSLPPRAPSEIEVVAHRGVSAEAPEHTLTAYQQALALGADAVECDVRMTRDGVLVCVHDRRINRTSTGRGVVSALDLAELERHRVVHRRPRGAAIRGRPSRPAAPEDDDEADEDAGRVLTLDRLLDYVTATPGRVRLAIETKHPTRHAGQVEAALLASLRRFGLLSGGRPLEWSGRPAVRVMSFSPTAVRRVRALAPELPTVHLVRQVLPRSRSRPVLPAGTAVGPSLAMLRHDPRLVARLHRAGLQVHVWVVNRPRDMQFAVSLGVDAIITDEAASLMQLLGRGGPPSLMSAG
ncbi:glycerophosphoryl diester phosphodiesterase [Geodermatophilus dictyosporus]|uniref:Glycerophosphoryl diester phosphodiesterase n=1 Tax=Geodermatophilus dictyosporus TaxID=1523247 RepID=A0A1I5J851_9ACTN|nr:glycerophosphodiester phosphodiesterase family protein [Geodermatophilus dictyosporus]SFO68937.1 glycerophosphoryl diester phosphodiesterase [Geodermatophilus dictyosporus]